MITEAFFYKTNPTSRLRLEFSIQGKKGGFRVSDPWRDYSTHPTVCEGTFNPEDNSVTGIQWYYERKCYSYLVEEIEKTLKNNR